MIRIATTTDAASIRSIYAPAILESSTSFEIDLPSIEEISRRMTTGLEKFPWLVWEENGHVGGYVYASTHRDRQAYQWTCECSVYLDATCKGKGIGRKLYNALFNLLKLQGLVNVYAGITLPNEASVKLHERCGFTPIAVYENIGYKFGIWHNVGWWQLQLNEPALQPPPPVKFSTLSINTVERVISQSDQLP